MPLEAADIRGVESNASIIQGYFEGPQSKKKKIRAIGHRQSLFLEHRGIQQRLSRRGSRPGSVGGGACCGGMILASIFEKMV